MGGAMTKAQIVESPPRRQTRQADRCAMVDLRCGR
jgi:hypothetical protein